MACIIHVCVKYFFFFRNFLIPVLSFLNETAPGTCVPGSDPVEMVAPGTRVPGCPTILEQTLGSDPKLFVQGGTVGPLQCDKLSFVIPAGPVEVVFDWCSHITVFHILCMIQ